MARGRQNERVQKIVRFPRWGFPSKLGMTLRASTSYNVAYAGTLVTHGVSCNNPFQPFITVTTTEVPSYLTFVSLAYDKIYVERATIRVEYVNSTVADSITTVLANDGTTSGVYTLNTLAESHDSQSRVIGYYSAGNNRADLHHQFTPQRYLGIAPNSADNMCNGGAPANQYYWVVGMQSVAGGTGNVAIRIVVEYDVVCTELASPSP